MSVRTISLPNLNQSSSNVSTALTSAAVAAAPWEVTHATAISFVIDGVTTAPGIQLQLSLTSSSGSTFYHARFQSSSAPTIYCTSSGLYTIPITAKLAQFGTSNVISTSYTVIGAYQQTV